MKAKGINYKMDDIKKHDYDVHETGGKITLLSHACYELIGPCLFK